jgi:hypothetical protein
MGLARTLTDFAQKVVNVAATHTAKRLEFEHVREAQAALLLLRGHADVLASLVAAGPHTYPSGWPIARSMLEVGARSAWRMHHDDPFESESRWLVWLRRQVKVEQNAAVWLDGQGNRESAAKAAERAAVSDEFCTELEALLSKRGVVVPRNEPSMRAVLADLGLEDRYHFYAEASERQHGTLIGLHAWTRNLGTAREFGQFARPIDWVEPLVIAMGGLMMLSDVYAYRTETPEVDSVRRSAWERWDAYRIRLGEVE